MNPVLILTHNCLEMTKRCVESVRKQDIETSLFIVDNASTDGTHRWLSEKRIPSYLFDLNMGVSKGWNTGIEWFETDKAEHVLVINNDTVIPPHFYRTLLNCDVPFVTGASSEDMGAVMQPPTVSLTGGPDFSAFLIRRECWETLGPFDEEMVHYCSDIDYDIRAQRMGIVLHNSHVKFYHERSSTLRLAGAEDRLQIQHQADADRQVFKRKYGKMPHELTAEDFHRG